MGCAFLAEGDNEAFFSCSYRSFGHFRRFVAKRLGFDLHEMEGYGGEKKWNVDPVFDGHIYFLFTFADCEGTIPADVALLLGTALSETLKDVRDFVASRNAEWVKGKRASYKMSKVPEQMDMFDRTGLFKTDIDKFINGLINAGLRKRDVYIY
jgi:hypothetical protein